MPHLCTVFCSYLLAKRWVWAYPKDQFDEAINTNNDIERQNRSFKYDFLANQCDTSLSGMLTVLCSSTGPLGIWSSITNHFHSGSTTTHVHLLTMSECIWTVLSMYPKKIFKSFQTNRQHLQLRLTIRQYCQVYLRSLLLCGVFIPKYMTIFLQTRIYMHTKKCYNDVHMRSQKVIV